MVLKAGVRVGNINDILQEFRDYLLDSATMSRHSSGEQDQMWAVFQSMLLQAPRSELGDAMLEARTSLEESDESTVLKGFGQAFRVEEETDS